jgi:hypothetical protein
MRYLYDATCVYIYYHLNRTLVLLLLLFLLLLPSSPPPLHRQPRSSVEHPEDSAIRIRSVT